jgi:hypothetical protein
MADGMNFNWFYCEGDLTPLVSGGQIPWEAYGFSSAGVTWAVANRYQLPNGDGVTVSMFPIENEVLFHQTVGQLITQVKQARSRQDESTAPWLRIPENIPYRVITQEECDTIHAQLLAEAQAREAEAANVPTEDDIYKAQQLLLLTELCNGMMALQDNQAGKEEKNV